MTILDDRPATAAAAPPASPAYNASLSSLSAWRVASRLARRDLRRRPGRTLLVCLLVAVPVFAMTAAIVIARTMQQPAETSLRPGDHTPDVVISGNSSSDVPRDLRLPAGAESTRLTIVSSPIEPATGRPIWTQWLIGDPSSAVTNAMFSTPDGRLPTGAGEIWLSESLALRIGAGDGSTVGVGDIVALRRPAGNWTVVGIGALANDTGWLGLDEPTALVSTFEPSRLVTRRASTIALVNLPGTPTTDEFDQVRDSLNLTGANWSATRSYLASQGIVERGRRLGTDQVAWGWVVGALSLAGAGIIIASAFATSARRQLRTIGLLSASGATQRVVRRTLALQGSWNGAAGSMIGIAGALIAVPLARGTIRSIDNGTRLGPWVIDGRDLAVIAATGVLAATIAALLPARSTSRIPVLAALAGRRPLGTVPRCLVPIGIGLFGAGVGVVSLLAWAGRGGVGGGGGGESLAAGIGVLGGLAILAGAYCASPLIVVFVGRVGARLPGSWRLASRSMARTRTRTAAVIMAIATAGIFAMAGATATSTLVQDRTEQDAGLPDDVVVVQGFVEASNGDRSTFSSLDGPTRRRIHAALAAALPGADIMPLRGGASAFYAQGTIGVADDALLDIMNLTPSQRAAIKRLGVVSAVSLPSDTRLFAIGFPLFVTPDRAAVLGLQIREQGFIVRSTAAITPTQREKLSDLSGDFNNRQYSGFIEPGDPPEAQDGSVSANLWLNYRQPPSWQPTNDQLEGAIAALALLFTSLVVAIALSLSAAESRDERDVLVAVGSSPRTLSRLAGVKAVVLCVAGGVLAVPIGFIPMAAVLTIDPSNRADTSSVAFPWVTALSLVVVVPIVAGLAAWACSALGSRVRPMHRLTSTDD